MPYVFVGGVALGLIVGHVATIAWATWTVWGKQQRGD